MAEMLAGLRVLDLSLWQPGHTATQLLADLGANVLKIEPPGGDPERIMADRVASYYTHKRSLVLDLKSAAGQARLLELAREAEVLVEGYRPGVAERLGAGYARLSAANPALVYCSITGFGQEGPLALAPGHEHNYQAWAGAYVHSGDDAAPVHAKPLVGDQGSGTAAAFAILAAVICARRTGVGEHIDVSMTDVIASWVAPAGPIGAASHGGAIRQPGIGEFQAGDGQWVVLGIFSENHLWDALCRELGLDDLVGLDMAARSQQADACRARVAACLKQSPRDELVARLARAGVPISPILSRAEAMALPHFRERGTFVTASDGGLRVAHPIRYRNHPARLPGRAPAIGEGGERGFD